MNLDKSIESVYLTRKSEQNKLTPKYDILHSFVPLVNNYHVTYEEDDKLFKITCQCCNGFLRCSYRSVELLHINFFHADMSTLGL